MDKDLAKIVQDTMNKSIQLVTLEECKKELIEILLKDIAKNDIEQGEYSRGINNEARKILDIVKGWKV